MFYNFSLYFQSAGQRVKRDQEGAFCGRQGLERVKNINTFIPLTIWFKRGSDRTRKAKESPQQ